MADPDSQSPAEGSEREQVFSIPQADSFDPGLNGSIPSLGTELKSEGLGALQDVTGRGLRRIGCQNLKAINHMSPAAAPSPPAGTSVSKQ